MGFLKKAKKNPGWMALSLQADGICTAHVIRSPSAKPTVQHVGFFGMDGATQSGVLERLVKELGLARYQCTTMLGAGEYQLLSVEAPNVPPDELKIAIRWRLKDLLDYHIDDATIDVLDVPVDRNTPGRNHSMYVVAARNQLIRQRQALFTEANIPLAVIDIPEMAQRNVSALLEAEGRGLAFLSFDAQGGLLTVSYLGELYLSRRIDIPLSQLEQGGADQRSGYFERITLELQRSLDHFDRQYHFITVSKMVLSPMGEVGAAMQAYLALNLYIPTEVLDLETVLDLSNTPDLRQAAAQQRHFMAIGTALRYEEKVP
jgi:MSHA biogenesis protein MshI